MKRMVDALVYEVRSETTRQYFACGKYSKQEVKVEKKKVTGIATEVCPKCKKDLIVSQPTAVATIKQDVILYCLHLRRKKISENQYIRLPKRIYSKFKRL
jgi:DNA topoisomerase-3